MVVANTLWPDGVASGASWRPGISENKLQAARHRQSGIIAHHERESSSLYLVRPASHPDTQVESTHTPSPPAGR